MDVVPILFDGGMFHRWHGCIERDPAQGMPSVTALRVETTTGRILAREAYVATGIVFGAFGYRSAHVAYSLQDER